MKHRHVKLFLFFFASFSSGFIIHALFFPYLFSEKQLDQTVKDVVFVKDSALKPSPGDQENDLVTYTNYSGGRFHPDTVAIKQSSYIAITNRDREEQLLLSSSAPFLNTKRPYIFGERLQTLIQKPGTYTVSNKLNSEAKLTIIVK